jgi:hypothetical protein
MAEASIYDDDVDLTELIGEEPFNDPRCFDSQRYREWEREVAEPMLRARGYEVLRWWSSDEDSFGPLVRCVEVRRDGVSKTYYYG